MGKTYKEDQQFRQSRKAREGADGHKPKQDASRVEERRRLRDAQQHWDDPDYLEDHEY
jgi:hypothetical protein